MSTATTGLTPAQIQAISDKWSYYAYDPSYAGAIAVAVVFFIMFIAHFYLMVKSKSYYMWPFVLAMFGETIGYALRRVSAQIRYGRGPALGWYIGQSLCIILAPALMAATHYMIFGRLIRYVGEKFSPIRAQRVTYIFVAFDVLSFITQGAGGSLYSSNNRALYPTAKAILIVGFLIQIISFGVFGICAGVYQRRATKAGIPKGGWTSVLLTLYIGCVLILIRSIFRTIEFGSGGNNTGYLLTHEEFYYTLEALPILLCGLLFIIRHPARHLPQLIQPSARLMPEDVVVVVANETTTSTTDGANEMETATSSELTNNESADPSEKSEVVVEKKKQWWRRS